MVLGQRLNQDNRSNCDFKFILNHVIKHKIKVLIGALIMIKKIG